MISKPADFGRIVGASAIFYYHVGLATDYPFSRWGEYAVAFFIILSGITYTCFSSVQPNSLSSYVRYMGAKLAAIFPIFVSINIAVFIASLFHPSALGRPFTLVELLLSSTGTSQYFGYRYLSTVMWFIPFILQAYLLFPVIESVLNRVSGVVVIIPAFVISLLFIAFVFHYWPVRASEICRNWSVIFRLPEVCLGVILGKGIKSRRNLRDGFAALGVFAGLSLLLATAVPSYGGDQAYILSLPWHGLIISGLVTIFAIGGTLLVGRRVEIKTLRLLGAASYPFFLGHGIAILFLYRRFGVTLAPWIIYFFICWISALALVYLLHRVRQTF